MILELSLILGKEFTRVRFFVSDMKVLLIIVWPFESGIFRSTIPPVINYWVENDLVSSVEVFSFGNVSNRISENEDRVIYRTLSTPFAERASITRQPTK
jgi:hypothetical protein